MPGYVPPYPQKKPGAPPGPSGPVGKPAPTAQQAFKAWDRLMHELAITTPKQLNRATFYRARLDDVVR